MTRFLFHAPAIVLLSLSSLVAQDVGRPVHKAINDFLSANPNRTVQVGSRGVTVYGPAIWSKGERIETLAEAREHAKGALRRYSDLLGLGAQKDAILVEELGIKLRQVTFLNYTQVHNGVPVQDGRVDVRVHEDGGISLMRSNLIALAKDFNTTPTIDAKGAEAIAVKHKAGKGIHRATRLIIFTRGEEGTAPRLAFEVVVADPDFTVWVDASTGAVLGDQNDTHSCGFPGCTYSARHAHEDSASSRVAAAAALRRPATPPAPATPAQPVMPVASLTGTVMAWTNTHHSATGAWVNTAMKNIQVRVTGVSGTFYTDAKGQFSIPVTLTTPYTVTVQFNGKHITDVTPFQGNRVSASVPVTPGTPATIQLLSSTASEWDRSQSTTYWAVNDINEWVRGIIVPNPSALDTLSRINSRVNYNRTCNATYSSGSHLMTFYAAGGSCNNTAFGTIVYHEWGHGIDNVFGGITQTDGLSEGWGDIMAMYRSGQPIVGVGFRTNNSAIRTGLNTRTYPVGGTSVHAKGETWMGFAWDVRTNLVNSLGNTAGVLVADRIVIGSVVANARNQPAAVLAVFIADDNDSNLNNGTPHYTQLSAAAKKRTLPFPELKLGTISHIGLKSTTDQLSARLVSAKVVANSGSFTKVELVYDDGSGAKRRNMVPSKTNSDMIALLPGVLSPKTVNYHIEAKHSTGPVVRMPATGEFGYSIGKEDVFFFDNMENLSSTTWTHGQTLKQDDWQHGAPTGKSGSSQSVSWRDPNKAYSGNYCRGNDLGIGNYNGAYQGNVENYLRFSSPVNLSGKTGVTLSYRRWLSTEGNGFDQATIRVNGATAWLNPTANLTDTAWSEQVVRLNAADNNPAMTLEYRLKTDPGLHLGGWAIDDVKLFSFKSLPPPAFQLTLNPAQVTLGNSTKLDLKGTPMAPIFLIVATTPGPTKIPGIPDLTVGGTTLLLPAALDANGNFSLTGKAPSNAASSGALLYIQAIEQTNASTVTATNPNTILFSK